MWWRVDLEVFYQSPGDRRFVALGGEQGQLCWNWGSPRWKINYVCVRTREQNTENKREEAGGTSNEGQSNTKWEWEVNYLRIKENKSGGECGESRKRRQKREREREWKHSSRRAPPVKAGCGLSRNFLWLHHSSSVFLTNRAPAPDVNTHPDMEGAQTCEQDDNMASCSPPREAPRGLLDRSTSFFKVRTHTFPQKSKSYELCFYRKSVYLKQRKNTAAEFHVRLYFHGPTRPRACSQPVAINPYFK